MRSIFRILIPLLFCLSATAQQWGDYTLYSVMGSTTTTLMDTNGTTVKTWTHPSNAKTGYSCYLMPGGFLWRSVARTGNSFTGGPINGEVQKVDWNGTVVWDYVYSTSDYCTHHDICPLPNGNVLLIAYDRISAANVTAAGCAFSGEVWCDKVVEIKPTGATTGEVVWEWRLWNHIVQNTDQNKPNYQSSIVNHPELLNVNYKTTKDWIHMNGVDYNPMLDQIAVSSHNLNEWYIIDHSTTTAEAATHSGGNSGKGGDILFRWGNPAAYGATGTAVLNVTHDAHWIPEGVPNFGRLVGFNNKGVSSSKSSVDQIVTPINGYNYDITLGSAFGPTTYDRHACNGYTSNAGSSDQLPNGNMMVTIALSGTIYEIDPKGNSIWTKTVTGAVQQAHRYSKCFAEGKEISLPIVSEQSGTLVATKGKNYQWFYNGQPISGETNASTKPTSNGVYLVRITDSLGCIYRYSTGFNFNGGTSVFNVTAKSDFASICAGDSVALGVVVSGASGATTYSWTSLPSGFSSSSASPKVAPSANTIYTVIASNNGKTDTSTVVITVNPKPSKPVITQNGSAIDAGSGVSYTWYLGGVEIKNATSQNYTPTQSGTYTVKVKNANGCVSDISDPFSFFMAGIHTTKYKGGITVFPNPANNTLFIEAEPGLTPTNMSISDVTGKIIHTYAYPEMPEVSALSNGLYYLNIQTEQGITAVFKVRVQH